MRRSPMPPRKAPLQRAPMKRALRPSMPVLDGPRPKPRPKRKGRSRVYWANRERAFERAGGVCVICRRRRARHGHHRLRQGQGGPDSVENILPVCHVCHDWVHTKEVDLARKAGWLIPMGMPVTPWRELPFWTDRKAA